MRAFPLGAALINVTECVAVGLISSPLATTRRDAPLPVALLETGLWDDTMFNTDALEGILLHDGENRRRVAVTMIGSAAAGLFAVAVGAGSP